MNPNDPDVIALSKAIFQKESGGDFNAVGDNGTSHGAGQWQASTWKAQAKDVLGDENAQMTPENQKAVIQVTIAKDKAAGLNPAQIAAKWNSGSATNWENKVGTNTINGQPIKYDVPAYVKGVTELYQKNKGATASTPMSNPTNSPTTALQSPVAPGQTQQPSAGSTGLQPPTPPAGTGQSNIPSTDQSQNPGFLSKLSSGDYGGAAVDAAKGVGNFLFPIVGDVYHDVKGDNKKTGLQQAADAGLSALSIIPGIGELGKGAEAAVDVAKAAPSLAGILGKGAAYGAGAGGLSSIGAGNTDIGSIAKDAAIGGITGGATGGLLGRLGGGSSALNKSATEDIVKVLAPTGKTDKLLTQEIAPQLAKSGITAASREGLLSKYEALKGSAGEALESGYDALPKNAKVEVGGLFDTLQQKIDKLTINGSVPSAAAPKVAALQNMMKDLANIGIESSSDGSKVFADVGNVRQLRQILDNTISKNFGLTELDGATKAAQKTLANSIRGAFSQQYPDIAKLNKDFNFWSNATKVLQNTIDRKTGQTGLLRKGLAEGVGAAGGLMSGHPIIGAGVMRVLSDFVSSPAYHTVSAALKSKIANAFEKGDYIGASKFMQGAINATPSLVGRGTAGLLGN